MDVWDRKTLKKISTIEAPNSSECAWSPDGRFLITATLSPRLRVDNGYKIWHFTGVLTHAQNYDELLQVGWRPANVELYPMRSSFSPPPPAAKNAGDFTVKPAPNGTYRPPHARGQETPVHFKREDETSIKSSIHNGVKHTPESLSKMAIKNKKKHEAAKKKRDEGAEVQTSLVTSSLDVSAIINNSTSSETKISKSGTSEAPKPPQSGGSALTETEKKIRNITKKLRQIAELKERQAAGDKLEQTQTLKIATEAALQRELQQLKT